MFGRAMIPELAGQRREGAHYFGYFHISGALGNARHPFSATIPQTLQAMQEEGSVSRPPSVERDRPARVHSVGLRPGVAG